MDLAEAAQGHVRHDAGSKHIVSVSVPAPNFVSALFLLEGAEPYGK